MRRAATLGVLVALASCEAVPPVPGTPRVLSVDILDAQDVQDGRPARLHLYDGTTVQEVPESGPDLTLRMYLSVPLSAQSLSDAPMLGLLVRDSEGDPVALRSFLPGPPDPPAEGAPDGAAQALSILPDLRSGRSYVFSLDRSYLLTDDMVRLDGPPAMAFRTARRFLVTRADPPDGASLREVAQIRLSLSSPVHQRPSGIYGVVLTAAGKPLEASFQLSGNGRQLTVVPLCPLPLGATQLTVPTDGVEEDDTLAPLAAPFQETLTVTEDPGPCTETADMAGMAPDLRAPDM